MEKKLFEKYYSRLKAEGILKALLCGAIAGFAVMFALAFATWFVYSIKFWVSIVTGVVVWAVVTAVFYYKKFRPTTLAIAKRVDSLGLEERLITMAELENDDSYIAMRQREDAQEKLREVESSRVKIKVRTATAVAAGVVMVLGVSMTTVKGLADSGALPSGGTVVDGFKPKPDPNMYAVSYIVEEGGYIDGEADQVVEEGGKTEAVVAIAEEGWQFVGWEEDENPNPMRIDADITEDMTFTALFQRVEASDGEGGGDGEGEGPEGEPSDEPSEGEGSSQNNGSGNPGAGGGSGGKKEDNDKVLNGETDYSELLPGSKAEAEALLASGNLTPRQRAFIEKYYGIINK